MAGSSSLSPRPLHLPGGLRAVRMFNFSVGMSTGCACLPEEGRRRERAPASWAGAWQRGGGGSAAVASRVWRASSLCGRGRQGAAPPPRVTSFVARGAGVGGLLPAGCSASDAELFFVSPGAGWKCGACTFAPARRLQLATHHQLFWLTVRPLPKGMSIGPPRGEFLEVGERRARWGCPTSSDPRPHPKVGAAGAAPPPPLCLLPPPSLASNR